VHLSMTLVTTLMASAAVVYALHRLALWMEKRGWIYYRTARGRGRLPIAVLEVQSLMDPSKQHVIEAIQRDDDEQAPSGDVPVTRLMPSRGPVPRRGRRSG
jgi:hypothetical protein